jgi:hypothetical protein
MTTTILVALIVYRVFIPFLCARVTLRQLHKETLAHGEMRKDVFGMLTSLLCDILQVGPALQAALLEMIAYFCLHSN